MLPDSGEGKCQAIVRSPCSGCVEIVFEGAVGVDSVEGAVLDFQALQSEAPPHYLIIDGADVTKYDGGVRESGRHLLEKFRQGGGKEVVFVIRSSVLRLLGATVGMMVRLPVRIFSDRDGALDYVRTRLGEARMR